MNGGLAADPTAERIFEELTCEGRRCACRASARKGRGLTHCPGHDDRNPSLSVDTKDGKVVVYCHAGCSQDAVIDALRERGPWRATPSRNGYQPDGYKSRQVRRAEARKNVSRDAYETAEGTAIAYHCRIGSGEGKQMWWEQPNGKLGLDGTAIADLPLFRLPQLLAAPPNAPRLLCEGEPAAKALHAHGFIATTLAGGAGQTDFGEALEPLYGCTVYLWPDNHEEGSGLMRRVAAALAGKADVRRLDVPGLPPKGDAADFFAAHRTAEELAELMAKASRAAAPPPEPRTLVEVVETFKKWLYLKEPSILYVELGTVAASRMEGDPVWLMKVGASSGGKTEVMNAISGLPKVHMAATMTEGALLSGTPKRDKSGDAKGGLLREIGDFGILICKDFTSVLSMNRDSRAALLAALREIYDGSWTRHVGVDGGRSLSWQGKVGLIAGCTAAIDTHHAVMAMMGERFLVYRLPDIDPAKQARKALGNTGREKVMRRELAEAVAGFFAGLKLPDSPPEIDEAEIDRLVALASLAARCRSAVERDGRTREVELILDPEAAARIAGALRRLYGGLLAIGLDRPTAWEVIVKVGLDSMPKVRRGVFAALVDTEGWLDTTAIALSVGYPTATARRALEDLTVHGVVMRKSGGEGKADRWCLSEWARAQHKALTFPEMSGDPGEEQTDEESSNNTHTVHDDISGKVLPADLTDRGEGRQTSCWNCKEALYEDTGEGGDPTCEQCGWLHCSACGACKNGCPGNEADRDEGAADEEGEEVWKP